MTTREFDVTQTRLKDLYDEGDALLREWERDVGAAVRLIRHRATMIALCAFSSGMAASRLNFVGAVIAGAVAILLIWAIVPPLLVQWDRRLGSPDPHPPE